MRLQRAVWISVFVFPLGATLFIGGCGDDSEKEPPPVTTMEAPTTTTTLVITTEPEPEPTASSSASASAPKSYAPQEPMAIGKCCAALERNKGSAPPDQQATYAQAIAVCRGLQASKDARPALAQVQRALAGIGAPAACR